MKSKKLKIKHIIFDVNVKDNVSVEEFLLNLLRNKNIKN